MSNWDVRSSWNEKEREREREREREIIVHIQILIKLEYTHKHTHIHTHARKTMQTRKQDEQRGEKIETSTSKKNLKEKRDKNKLN